MHVYSILLFVSVQLVTVPPLRLSCHVHKDTPYITDVRTVRRDLALRPLDRAEELAGQEGWGQLYSRPSFTSEAGCGF